MTVINLTHYPFVNGTTPTGTQVSEVFYLPANVPVSLDGLNGHLDKTNADASFTQVTYDQVQENSFHYAGTTFGTANLDYFKTWFSDISLSAARPGPTSVNPKDYLTRFIPIPGASATFYLPDAALVVLTWTIGWGSDSRAQCMSTTKSRGGSDGRAGADSYVALFVDNALQTAQMRQCSRSIYPVKEDGIGKGMLDADSNSSNGTVNLEDNVHLGMIKNRYWHGHCTVSLAAGWHNISLRLLSGSAPYKNRSPQRLDFATETGGDGYPHQESYYDSCRQTRVWARSLRYVALRRSG